jgi:hypothetical protein
MKKAKLWIIIFLVFILGALAGSLGTHLYIHGRVSDFFRKSGHARVQILLARMSRDFGLTDAQQIEIKGILQESHNRIHEIKTQTDPHIRAIIDDGFRRIR